MIKTSNFLLGGFLSLTLVSGVILASSKTSAEDVKVSDVSIAVPASCEISGSGMSSHTADVDNGTYRENIGKTTITVFCNDGGGYAIYAAGYTGDEIGGTNSTKLVGVDTNLTIDTGVYTQGTTVSSVWAMKLNKVTDTSVSYTPANLTIENGFNSYHIVPSSYTKVASFSSTTDLTLGSKLETTYAAFVSGTQRADVYNGKVKYTLVHPASGVPNTEQACNANTICYFPNANGLVTDTMSDQGNNYNDNNTAITSNMDVNLWPSNFKRSGYGFVGWSNKYDWVLNENDANGNGTGANLGYHIYGPMANINVGDVSTKGLSLYAVWAPTAGYLQGYTCPDNSTMPIGTVTALTDQRDNDTYAIAKLADGKCWMIENLRLDYDANFDESLSQGFGKSTTYGNFVGLAKPETANFSNSTSANSIYYSGTQSGTASINIGTTDYAGYRMPRYRNDNTNSNSTINPNTTEANMTAVNQSIYSYGNYYTWSAALANTIYYNSPTATDADGKTSETVNTSLCPAGWKLPRGGNKSRESTNDFWALIVTGINGGTNPANYDSNDAPYYSGDPESVNASKTVTKYPNNFVYSGTMNNSSLSRGTAGCYWTSTTDSSAYAYGFLVNGVNRVYPGTYYQSNFKYYGKNVRCMVSS